MKPGIKKRKPEEMKDVVISDTMISIKISRGNEYLFKALKEAVDETGIKSRNKLLENMIIDYVEEREKMKLKAMKEAYIKKPIESSTIIQDFEQRKIAE